MYNCVCRSGLAVVNAVLGVFVGQVTLSVNCVCRSGLAVVNAVLGVFVGQVTLSVNCVCRSGLAVVNAVLDVFSRLSCWWSGDVASVESKMMSSTLLLKLTIVDATVLSNSQHPTFVVIWTMYIGLLTDRTTSLAFKV